MAELEPVNMRPRLCVHHAEIRCSGPDVERRSLLCTECLETKYQGIWLLCTASHAFGQKNGFGMKFQYSGLCDPVCESECLCAGTFR